MSAHGYRTFTASKNALEFTAKLTAARRFVI
jgi:hypothetical protein